MKKILLMLLVVVGILVFFNKEDIPLQNKQYTEVKMPQDTDYLFFIYKKLKTQTELSPLENKIANANMQDLIFLIYDRISRLNGILSGLNDLVYQQAQLRVNKWNIINSLLYKHISSWIPLTSTNYYFYSENKIWANSTFSILDEMGLIDSSNIGIVKEAFIPFNFNYAADMLWLYSLIIYEMKNDYWMLEEIIHSTRQTSTINNNLIREGKKKIIEAITKKVIVIENIYRSEWKLPEKSTLDMHIQGWD